MRNSRKTWYLCNHLLYSAHKSWHSKQGGLPFRELSAQLERLSDQSGGLAVICSAISTRVPHGWSKMHRTLPGKTHEVCVSAQQRGRKKQGRCSSKVVYRHYCTHQHLYRSCVIAPLSGQIDLTLWKGFFWLIILPTRNVSVCCLPVVSFQKAKFLLHHLHFTSFLLITRPLWLFHF